MKFINITWSKICEIIWSVSNFLKMSKPIVSDNDDLQICRNKKKKHERCAEFNSMNLNSIHFLGQVIFFGYRYLCVSRGTMIDFKIKYQYKILHNFKMCQYESIKNNQYYRSNCRFPDTIYSARWLKHT